MEQPRVEPNGFAFPTVIGSGPNSALIHALRCDRLMKKGEMMFIDFGIDIGGYCGDVSRAGPVHCKKFTEPQVFHSRTSFDSLFILLNPS